MPNGVVAFMREQLGVGRAVRAGARRPAPRARHRALPAGAAARADAGDARSRLPRRSRSFPPTEGAGVIVFCVPDERWLRRLLSAHGPRAVPGARTRRALPLERRKCTGVARSMLSLGLDLSERPRRARRRGRRRRGDGARGNGAGGAEAVRRRAVGPSAASGRRAVGIANVDPKDSPVVAGARGA